MSSSYGSPTGLSVTTGTAVSTATCVTDKPSGKVDDGYFLVKRSDFASLKEKPSSATALIVQGSSSSGSSDDEKRSSQKFAVLRSLRSSMLNSRVKHPKYGSLDVYKTILTYANGATSDAGGTLPGFFPVANITSTAGWSALWSIFDMVRVQKVVYHWYPKLGYKSVRSFTPLTANANNLFRVREDPDGAIGSPTVAQVNEWVPQDKGKKNGLAVVETHNYVEPFTFTYVPRVPVVRAGAASTITRINLHDWVDTIDVNSYASTMLVGGITWNSLSNGGCPASTDVFGVLCEFHVEFALRSG